MKVAFLLEGQQFLLALLTQTFFTQHFESIYQPVQSQYQRMTERKQGGGGGNPRLIISCIRKGERTCMSTGNTRLLHHFGKNVLRVYEVLLYISNRKQVLLRTLFTG